MIKTNYLCILSGIITAIGFSFPSLNFLIWFSLIPCFYVLFNQKTFKQGFIIMFIYGITFYSLLYLWMWGLYPLDWLEFNNIKSILLILIGWLGLSLFQTIFISILGGLCCVLGKDSEIKWAYLVLLWILMEWSQEIGMMGITWGRLANSQFNNPYIIQSASLFGSLLVSAIIVLANSFIAYYLYNKNYIYLIGFFIVFFINFSYGYYRVNNIKDYEKKIQASVIQGNIETKEKWSSSILDTLETHIEITKIANNNSENKLDLVVWSETSIPVTLPNYPEFLDECYKLSKLIDSNILVGAFENIDNNLYNAIFNISPNNEIQTYHKQRLVPFGEYLPFSGFLTKIFPNIKNISANKNDISVGKNKEAITTQDFKIATLICFDSVFPEITRQQVFSDSEIIAISTNDSWFNGTTAPRQHLSQAVMRAVENNRYVLRSANTGISAIISNTGKILSILEPEVKGYLNHEVVLINDKTLYTKLGDIIVAISILILICMIITKFFVKYILNPIIKKLAFYFSIFTK